MHLFRRQQETVTLLIKQQDRMLERVRILKGRSSFVLGCGRTSLRAPRGRPHLIGPISGGLLTITNGIYYLVIRLEPTQCGFEHLTSQRCPYMEGRVRFKLLCYFRVRFDRPLDFVDRTFKSF